MYPNIKKIKLQSIPIELINLNRNDLLKHKLHLSFDRDDEKNFLHLLFQLDPQYDQMIPIETQTIEKLIEAAVGLPDDQNRTVFTDLDQTNEWQEFFRTHFYDFTYHLLHHGLLLKNHPYFGFVLMKTKKKHTAYFAPYFTDHNIKCLPIYPFQSAETPEQVLLFIPYYQDHNWFYGLFELTMKPSQIITMNQSHFYLPFERVQLIENKPIDHLMQALMMKMHERMNKEMLFHDPEDANQLNALYLQFFQNRKKTNRFDDLF